MSQSCFPARFSACFLVLSVLFLCSGCGAEPDLSSPRAFSASIAGKKGILDNRVIKGVRLNDPYFDLDGKLMPGSTLVFTMTPKLETDPALVEGVVIKDADINGLTLESVEMKGGLFTDVTFTGCSFVNVKFTASVFQRVRFIDCRFEGKGPAMIIGYPPEYTRKDDRTLFENVHPDQLLFENCVFGRYVEQQYLGGSVAMRGISQVIGGPNKEGACIRGINLDLLIEDCNFDHKWVTINSGPEATIFMKNSTVKGAGLSGSDTRVTYVESCTLSDIHAGSARTMVFANSKISAEAVEPSDPVGWSEIYIYKCSFPEGDSDEGEGRWKFFSLLSRKEATPADLFITDCGKIPRSLSMHRGNLFIADTELAGLELGSGYPHAVDVFDYINLKNVVIGKSAWKAFFKRGLWENVDFTGPVALATTPETDLTGYNVRFYESLPFVTLESYNAQVLYNVRQSGEPPSLVKSKATLPVRENAAPLQLAPTLPPSPEDLGLTKVWSIPFFEKTDKNHAPPPRS